MKLSQFALKELVPLVIGEGYLPYRSGSVLVSVFNKFGMRDIYEFNNGGFPKSEEGRSFSRSTFAESRLQMISDKNNLRELLEFILNNAESREGIGEKMNEIIQPEGYTVSFTNDKYSIDGGVINNTKPVKNNAHFEKIQNGILAALDKAQVSIWVAMAWFTNDMLFDKLVEKSNEGIDVRLAIYDDGVNRTHGPDFSVLNPTLLKRALRGGIPHNKFCIIDNQIVITGSYNWTTNAETRNDENATVTNDPEQATKFSVEFKRLVSGK